MTARPWQLADRSRRVQWLTLLVLSLVVGGLALAVHLPAALMIGPMIAAICIAFNESKIRLPAFAFMAAQGVVGCMVGRGIPISILSELGHHWPLFVFGILSVLAAASMIGYLLTRWKMFPGTTAIWGTSPGASTAMILMAEAYGGDPRLVAVMQQLRIVSVIGIAALVARLSGVHPQSSAATIDWLGSNHWLAMLGTLAIALSGALIAPRIGMPAGSILVPMAAAMALNGTGLMRIELPGWLLALAYAGIGWSIGLRFTRPIIAYAFLALPRILISTLTLIAICGLIAAVLVVVGGIDPLTAYLATSPGGADSIAIIAASSTADLRFVMAMQTSRLIVAMFVSPALSRFVTRQAQHFAKQPEELSGR